MEEIRAKLASALEPLGFEIHPFLVGWYNDLVADKFKLPHRDDVLAFVILSQPSMFEKCFLPYLMDDRRRGESDRDSDPLDKCLKNTFIEACRGFDDCEIIHDFELMPNRRPKIVAQTAAHVSGAVKLFRKEDLEAGGIKSRSGKLYPVCLHPKFGGWFGIRAAVIFKTAEAENLPKKSCEFDLNAEDTEKVLELFNDCWRDWRYRDVGVKPVEKYSDLQMEYFATKPAERHKIVERLKKEKLQLEASFAD